MLLFSVFLFLILVRDFFLPQTHFLRKKYIDKYELAIHVFSIPFISIVPKSYEKIFLSSHMTFIKHTYKNTHSHTHIYHITVL